MEMNENQKRIQATQDHSGNTIGETMNEAITAAFNPHSATSGIQEAIDALGQRGGRVRIPAGDWRLRQSVVLPSRVSLVGDGPATELTIAAPYVLPLTHDAQKGSRSVHVQGHAPFAPGDAVGLVDNPHQWWDGTHALVTSVEGSLVQLSAPLNEGLTVKEDARIVSLFPGITTDGIGPPVARKLTQDADLCDLTLRGSSDREVPLCDFTYSAVHLVRCHRMRVLNVSIFDWPSDGIGVQGGSDVQVAHCQVSRCSGNGFHPGTGLERSVWSHNIAIGNGGDGLFFCGQVHDSVCSDSVFTGNGFSGIGGVGHADDHHNIISDNVCSENAKWGINASDGVEQVITGNLLRSNSLEEAGAYPALRLHNAKRFLVQGNRCADDQDVPTQTRGIVESGDSDWNLVSGNLCVGMAEPVTVVGRNSRAEGNLM
jgi:parallel beta-helix repeat protein